MKNRVILIMALVIYIFVFTGCGKKTKITNEEYIQLNGQKSFCSDLAVESEWQEGYSLIYFYDYKSNNEIYACGQANCSHELADYKSGKINCNAIIEGEAKYPFLYNNQLYYFVENGAGEILWQSNVDGTEKQKLLETDFNLYEGNFVMANGNIYVSSNIREEINYDEHTSALFTVQSEVYEISIGDKSVKQLTKFGKKAQSECRSIQYFENKLYIKYCTSDNTYAQAGFHSDDEYLKWLTSDDFSYAKDIKLFGKKENYYIYDFATKKVEQMDIGFESNFKPYKGLDNMDSYYIVCVSGNKMYYLDPVTANYTIYLYDFATKEREEIIKKYQISSSYSDGKIYITSVDMDQSTKEKLIPSVDLNSEPKYYIYDVKSEKLIQQNYGKKGMFYYVIDTNEDGLLAYQTVFDERYNFIDEHNFYEIPKEKIR